MKKEGGHKGRPYETTCSIRLDGAVSRKSEAQVGDEIAALVPDHERALGALERGLGQQYARRSVVFRATDALGGHHSELILRVGRIPLRRLRQQGPRLDGIR